MKFLVTGASGFIGNFVVKKLLEQNHHVVVISRDISKLNEREWFAKVELIQFDISDFCSEIDLFNFFGKPDVLINLAWDGLPNFLDTIHIDKNLFHHYFFLKKYIESGGKHIVVTGTCLEYGNQSGLLNEELLPMPECSYAVAKDSLRRFLLELQKGNDFIFQWIRLFYMFGEGQNDKSILPQLDKSVKNGNTFFDMSGGEQLRDYLPIEKVAENVCKVATQIEITGIINCSSGKPISVRKLVEDYIYRNKYSIKLNIGVYPYPTYEPMAFWGNNSKLNLISSK